MSRSNRFSAGLRALALAATPVLALAPGVVLVPVLVAGCASTEEEREGDWVEMEMTVASERVLRQVAALALERNGFPPGTEESGAQQTVSSGWNVVLQPFKGDGSRTKAHIEYEERSPRKWLVGVRVQRESNEELAKPLELARAQWETQPDDRATAARILGYMQTVFGREFELGPKGAPTEAERNQIGQ
jgi:hypothetical protein